ncbi:hypothetical protein [Nocardia sp. NPDC050717]
MAHLRRWGAVYLLLLLFLGSWGAQIDDLRGYLVPPEHRTEVPGD